MHFNKYISLAIVFFVMCKALAVDQGAVEQSAIKQDYIEQFYKKFDINETTIHQLPKEEQIKIIEHYRAIDPHLELYDKIKCINLIHNIPEKERKNILDIVNHIRTHAVSQSFTIDLIKGITAVEQTKRQHVIKHIEPLFNIVSITETFIKAIGEIPIDQMQEVIDYTIDIANCATPLTKQKIEIFMRWSDINKNICEIITAISKLDPTRRKDIINDVKPLIVLNIISNDIALIIEAVDALPDKDRKEIISITEEITISKQCGYKMLRIRDDSIHNVIKAINKVPYYNKRGFIDKIKHIAIIYMLNYYMSGVIEKLSEVPIRCLDQVIKNIESKLIREYGDEDYYKFNTFSQCCTKENYMHLSKL